MIAFDASSSSGGFSGTPQSWNHTCTGSNVGLVVFLFTGAANGTTGNCTVSYNGVSMTKLDAQIVFGTVFCAVYYLANAPTGTHSITVTQGASTTGMIALASSYTGTAATNPTITGQANNTSSLAMTPSVTGSWFAMGTIEAGTLTAGSGTVRRQNGTDPNGYSVEYFDSNTAGTSGVPYTLNISGSSFNLQGVVIPPLVPPPASGFFMAAAR